MISPSQFGPVTIFKNGKHVAFYPGWILYETHAFHLGNAMVDTGTAAVEREWGRHVKCLDCSVVINTHHHEDHIGNNRYFQEKFGSRIFAHEKTLPYLEDPSKIGMQLYRRVVWANPSPSRGAPIGNSISAGKYNLQVIHAPGHCPDHICLYETVNAWLFSGDIFCGKRFDYLRKDEDYGLILDSLKKLAQLDIRTIFCGFRGVVENGKGALSSKISFMEELRDRTLEMYGKGTPPRKIRQKLLGNETAMCFITFGHYSKQNTIDSIIAEGFPVKHF